MLTTIMPGWQTSCFASLIAVALTVYHRFHPTPGTELPEIPQPLDEYDFVIIGAGSAGAVMANRLTENKEWNVLLLEAGGRETEYSEVPGMANNLIEGELDWKFLTAPLVGEQRYCLAMTNHQCRVPRGKATGGSSVINNLFYIRGNRHDYDHWEALGNVGWGYEQVLKYFMKSENNSDPELVATPYHAAGGYQSVQDFPLKTRIGHMLVEGGKYLGYPHRDVNLGNQTGFNIPQATIRDGARCSTAKAFLVPITSRPNFHLSLFSLVTKINIDSNLRATSVTYFKNGQEHVVRAKKEVILSAGGIDSPKLLMLSGIGPAEHLIEHNIHVVKNLPVGENLQEHISTVMSYTADPSVTLAQSETMNPDTLTEYILERKGPLSSLAGDEAVAFVNTRYADPSGSFPDIQFQITSRSIFNEDERPIGQRMFNFRPDLFNRTAFAHLQNASLFSIMPILIHPESRGTVRLHSSNPFDPPLINPNYLAKQIDVDRMIDGMRIAREVLSTPPFKAVNAAPLGIHFPGCEAFPLESEGYSECLVRHWSRNYHHWSGTCRMGLPPVGVVDPRLRVYGIKGLRVVDASIMPTVAGGNTNAPSIMIGEKGADLVKEDWYAAQFGGEKIGEYY